MSISTYPIAPPIASRITLRGAAMSRIAIGRALIDNCSSEQACTAIIAHAQSGGKPAHVITPNAQHIVLLEKSQDLRDAYKEADLVIPDGMSLLMAARLYGRSLQQRVAGVDLLRELCGRAAKCGLRVFFLGGRPGSAEIAAAALRRDYPDLDCSSYCPPLGFERTPEGLQQTADAVTAAHPDLLFVALGAPKQEWWIHNHGLQLAVPVCMGVGGSFEMIGGIVRRAPLWAQNNGFEWLYRLCREPRRMWRRYLIGNLQFAAIVLRQCIRRSFFNLSIHLVKHDSFSAEFSEFTLSEHHRDAEQAYDDPYNARDGWMPVKRSLHPVTVERSEMS